MQPVAFVSCHNSFLPYVQFSSVCSVGPPSLLDPCLKQQHRFAPPEFHGLPTPLSLIPHSSLTPLSLLSRSSCHTLLTLAGGSAQILLGHQENTQLSRFGPQEPPSSRPTPEVGLVGSLRWPSRPVADRSVKDAADRLISFAFTPMPARR